MNDGCYYETFYNVNYYYTRRHVSPALSPQQQYSIGELMHPQNPVFLRLVE